jgi:hypothetical protein
LKLDRESVVLSIATLHYVVALILIVDSLVFMSGFFPFFIINLTPASYLTLLVYSITAGSLLHCFPRKKRES